MKNLRKTALIKKEEEGTQGVRELLLLYLTFIAGLFLLALGSGCFWIVVVTGRMLLLVPGIVFVVDGIRCVGGVVLSLFRWNTGKKKFREGTSEWKRSH